MRGLTLLPLLVAIVHCDTLYFRPRERPVSGVSCPDNKTVCPDGSTCCAGKTEEYLCCPLSSKASLISGNVMCPDGQHECKDGQTCCKLASGQWGCCPIPKAVCCSDGKHCCPENTKCEVSQGKCMRGTGEMLDWFEKEPALVRSENVVCPDGQSECKSGQTCCKLASGNYGCCPIPKAVCCSDMKHCCPEGTTCDVSSGKCNRGNTYVMDWMDKQPAVVRAGSVMCPDGQHECKDGQTCCKLASGQWGCCPIPKAVCCNDGKHCCPENTKCEVSQGKCTRGTGLVLDWFEKLPALKRPGLVEMIKKDNTIVCPDQKTSCPDKNTCCKNKEGKFGCCAYNNAVCCKSGTYCCPKGYICDTLPEICRMPEAKEAWKNTANRFIQNILRRKVQEQP